MVSNSALSFTCLPLRFELRARESIFFPPGKAANVVRGSLGMILHSLVCPPECSSFDVCNLTCLYKRVFAPRSVAGPSGFADPPRPFVLRAAHLDGRRFDIGDCFHIGINLFDVDPGLVQAMVLSFAQLALEGLGPSRGMVDLLTVSVTGHNDFVQGVIYTNGVFCKDWPKPVIFSLQPEPLPVSRVRITFRTPTELKGVENPTMPTFAVFFARLRDRISALQALYGDGPLDIDFQGMGERAQEIRLDSASLNFVDIVRRSSRTRQTHPLGGWIGTVEYSGNLTEYMPYLLVGVWTGIGRQTVWGKGFYDYKLI